METDFPFTLYFILYSEHLDLGMLTSLTESEVQIDLSSIKNSVFPKVIVFAL